ncbi:MAG: potassium-transporting ATPase subunit KdpC [Acetobacter aceti]|jgi:K+-transporting ATPase ATPase C chain|uniref:Potassium-transporting ATPase KdpC subunit n=5 Tax=Acetobacteraceae TaxID=433 RepID=A0A1U9KJ69_ACEAC|nr:MULTISPECIES: potassium-transporting ATPase subunit KdpC [Acetobacteraceae]AQS85855.1 potassium-transporting ATPase subunit C [Acetobacter aceti]KXV50062.1 potassium-transporting ATPase subunit C [Gluconobacter albidus]TCS27166.1 K+-transporting ATPase ATPase C chain [Acidomonas methanolica]GAJ29061.1 potassium transporter ATPase subunit C KdpC [Acidomonas methanolica NBRC 104435]GBQ49609.1 potassium transporter ATPase C chain KdpC [Acidomonas methanolica]
MLRELRPALVLFLFLSVVTGVLYPLAITGAASVLFPRQAGGSLVLVDGKPVGSELIGQNFTSPRYFHPRPSATSGPDPVDASKSGPLPYNAAASVGSNLGPTSKSLVDRVTASVAALRAENPEAVREGLAIPADLVTTSGSGLDPDISPQAARFQVSRIAAARKLPEERVHDLILRMTQAPLAGVLGEPRINVLRLNLALDAMK